MATATTLDALDAALKTVLELCARGVLAELKARALKEICTERRQVLAAIEEQRRAMDAGKPVEVVCVWENSWEPKVKANQEASK